MRTLDHFSLRISLILFLRRIVQSQHSLTRPGNFHRQAEFLVSGLELALKSPAGPLEKYWRRSDYVSYFRSADLSSIDPGLLDENYVISFLRQQESKSKFFITEWKCCFSSCIMYPAPVSISFSERYVSNSKPNGINAISEAASLCLSVFLDVAEQPGLKFTLPSTF